MLQKGPTRMMYNGKLSVCLLDLQLGGVGLYPKGIVVSEV